MISTSAGTVLIGVDARMDKPGDNPNNIDMWVRRSLDSGETWDDPIVVMDYPGQGETGAAAIDSSLVQDRSTGRIFLLYVHTPGGIGLWASQNGVGFDNQKRRLIYRKSDEGAIEYYLDEATGKLFDGSEQLVMDVSIPMPVGNVIVRGAKSDHNIYLHLDETDWYEARTSFLTLHYSDNDGLTWSDPIWLDTQVKAPWMKFIGAGPGNGIQLRHGPRAGRLVYPIYFTNEHTRMSASLIYSDDHGQTWQRGESPNDGRLWEGVAITARSLDGAQAQLTESQVVELSDGTLKIYMRNHAGTSLRAVAESDDQGNSWGEVTFDQTLTDPICQGTVVSVNDAADDRILFANANSSKRENGTVRLSLDGGKTWPYSRVIEPDSYTYSSLAMLPDGSIGLYYEVEQTNALRFATFTLDWLTGET